MSTFQGIPTGAFEFYAELEHNNNREWWLEHKDSYDTLVRDPVTALLAELEPRFGPGKIFRPNRDIRFSPDKSPYKTAQGAFASAQEGVGYYLQVSADGLLVGGGYHSHTPAQLARFRNSVDASGTGESLRHIVDGVAAAGFVVEGEKLKTVPRGYDRDHARGELLKHKSLSAGIELGQPAWVDTPEAARKVAELWDQLRPLVEWVGRHAAP
ncbi:DUF2461 domain-containing protein [Pseudarthrobacter sulfonivorans]|uniref:DUF2461 domain-containing protein n=1 Tax=Pseudarthrobacter sulfonivorans TaxID=121292 RepID=UPI00285B1BC0|nr:DUF2461 domain-containing protein [Pseudarthrobacter sulfonivorans]MDR6413426.1 uncharacterized protein (TIGR02453 family) [Pseudarthrobacter sulfonivorans]